MLQGSCEYPIFVHIKLDETNQAMKQAMKQASKWVRDERGSKQGCWGRSSQKEVPAVGVSWERSLHENVYAWIVVVVTIPWICMD